MLIAAAAPPGGGRSVITTRFTRHFSILTVPDSNQEILTDIFSKIIKNFLKVNQFRKEIYDVADNNAIVFATLIVYDEI